MNMNEYGIYLVCKEHIREVEDFLEKFLEKIENKYTHKEWITFKAPSSNFLVNLMVGNEQEMTKNITFEIYCNSLIDLQKFSLDYGMDIQNFVADKSSVQYRYNYIEILGPADICKI